MGFAGVRSLGVKVEWIMKGGVDGSCRVSCRVGMGWVRPGKRLPMAATLAPS